MLAWYINEILLWLHDVTTYSFLFWFDSKRVRDRDATYLSHNNNDHCMSMSLICMKTLYDIIDFFLFWESGLWQKWSTLNKILGWFLPTRPKGIKFPFEINMFSPKTCIVFSDSKNKIIDQYVFTAITIRSLINVSSISVSNTAWKVSVFGVFLVCISPDLDWIRRDIPHLSLFSPNAGKYEPEKFQIRTLFTQCKFVQENLYWFSKNWNFSVFIETIKK